MEERQLKTLRRKLRQETRITPEEGFPAVRGMHYLLVLQHLHETLKPKVYFEIGTESGASLSFATCTSIAVDPNFQLQADISRNKPELHQYQGTSDDFFASGMLNRLGLTVDLAFLDGMHLFEYLLRDFINIERFMAPDGVVTLHDCVPFNHVIAERDWDRTVTRAWTGDVWKIIPILREYRPDLKVSVIDAAPTGLVVIQNLDPNSRLLVENYSQIIEKYSSMDLHLFGPAKLQEVVALKRVGDFDIRNTAKNFEPVVAKQRIIDKVVLRTSIPNASRAKGWGDWWFAVGIQKSFESLGLECVIDFKRNWGEDYGETCLNLYILGHDEVPLQKDRLNFVWYIYPGDRVPEQKFPEFDHVFVASSVYADQLRLLFSSLSLTYLPQAFDGTLMQPAPEKPTSSELVFVANAHFERGGGVAAFAHHSGNGFKLWGDRWSEPFDKYVVAKQVANGELCHTYASSLAVMCDHHPQMKNKGFVSNRIFDALACGVPVISDRIAGLPAEFKPYVLTVNSPDEFAHAVEQIRHETPEQAKARRQFALDMRETHSFDARCASILNVVREKGYIVHTQTSEMTG